MCALALVCLYGRQMVARGFGFRQWIQHLDYTPYVKELLQPPVDEPERTCHDRSTIHRID